LVVLIEARKEPGGDLACGSSSLSIDDVDVDDEESVISRVPVACPVLLAAD
jgi:hypothetical protein